VEPLEDLEPAAYPDLPSLKRPPERLLAEVLLVVKVPEKLELLFEGGPPGRVVTAQALELGLEHRPVLHDCPGARRSPFPERHEALEAIDEKEAPLPFDDDEGIIAVHLTRGALWAEELEGDLLEWDLSESHR
jgi:hypothetical protein